MYRDQTSGVWRIKKNFGMVNGVNIGPVNLSLGTKDEREASALEQSILSLPESHGERLLLDLKNKLRSPLEVHRLVQTQQVRKIGKVSDVVYLSDALNGWIDTARKKDGRPLSGPTDESYRKVISVLTKFAGPHATVRDLPDVFARYREQCITGEKNRTVQKTRTTLLSFARSYENDGSSGELYIALKKLETAPAGRKRQMNGLMVWQARQILAKLPERWRNISWALVCCGMGETEYRNGFDVLADRVIVHGSKNDNRKRRTIPKISEFTKERLPKVLHDFRKALSDASGGTVRPYDLRGTYRLWLKGAGIPDERARRYMGHVTMTVEQGYLTTHVDNYLREDTEKLIAYLRANWEPPKEEEKAKPIPVFIPKF